MIYAKHFCVGFDKIDGFIGAYDGSRYLVLFRSEKYDSIYMIPSYRSKKWHYITYFS